MHAGLTEILMYECMNIFPHTMPPSQYMPEGYSYHPFEQERGLPRRCQVSAVLGWQSMFALKVKRGVLIGFAVEEEGEGALSLMKKVGRIVEERG